MRNTSSDAAKNDDNGENWYHDNSNHNKKNTEIIDHGSLIIDRNTKNNNDNKYVFCQCINIVL